MRRTPAVLAAAAAIAAAFPAAVAGADPVRAPSCHGALISFAAENGGGLEAAAAQAGMTPKQYQQSVTWLCDFINSLP